MTILHVLLGTSYPFALGVGYCLRLWQTKGEIDRARWELSQEKLTVDTQSVAQQVLRITEMWKKRMGTRDLTFSEDELRESLREADALRLSAALDLLLKQGRARQVGPPGYWEFD
jgi:hypothetical protein